MTNADETFAQLFAEATRADQSRQFERAEQLYLQALAWVPAHAEVHHRLGLLCSRQARHSEAVAYLRRGLALAGPNPIYFNNLGEALRRQGQLMQAIDCYRQALRLAPQFAEAHYNLANVLKLCDQLDQAIAHYEQALRLKPDYARAHYNLGNALFELGRLPAAANSYACALQIDPRSSEAHNNLGAVLREQGQLAAAAEHFRHAIQLNPGASEAYRNLATVLDRQGDRAAARAAGQQALALAPDDHAFRLYINTLAPVIPSDNAEIDHYRADLLATLRRAAERGLHLDLSRLHTAGCAPPMALAYQGRDDRLIKQHYAALFDQLLPHTNRSVGAGKPRVGFVVTHGHEGVFLKCMRGVLNHFPPDCFDVTVVCSQPSGEQVLRPQIANPNLRYLQLPARVDRAAEQLVAAHFDLLYYWEVGTDLLNYLLPFCRAAPVQCAGWGWPVTSGIPQIDYFISSALLETDASATHYTEQLVRLAHLPTYYYRPPVPTPLRPRAQFGLNDADHLYVCTQNLRKLHPDFDRLLAAILRADPAGRVLLIADTQPELAESLRRRFQTGIPDVAAHIQFLPQMAEADYLNVLALADLALDTLHYGGGANTIYDAFAAGTPVVTLPTQFQRGRYAYAAYQQMGIHDAIAGSPEEYVAITLTLGTNRAARADLSAWISAACPLLFEDTAAVAELADFFAHALDRARDRLTPQAYPLP